MIALTGGIYQMKKLYSVVESVSKNILRKLLLIFISKIVFLVLKNNIRSL
jgi:hypothetical protein